MSRPGDDAPSGLTTTSYAVLAQPGAEDAELLPSVGCRRRQLDPRLEVAVDLEVSLLEAKRLGHRAVLRLSWLPLVASVALSTLLQVAVAPPTLVGHLTIGANLNLVGTGQARASAEPGSRWSARSRRSLPGCPGPPAWLAASLDGHAW